MAKHRGANSTLRFSHRSYWYFFAAFIIFGFVWLYSLRQNNLTAIRLSDELLQVDKQNGDVEKALRNLREHMYNHMNSDLSSANNLQHPIQLKYRYERLIEVEKTRVSLANSKVYSDAQVICEQRFPVGLRGSGRIPCIQEYVAQNGAKEQPINDSLYKFDFISPTWSPDLAGWSLVFSVIFLVLFIIGLWLDRRFKKHLYN